MLSVFLAFRFNARSDSDFSNDADAALSNLDIWFQQDISFAHFITVIKCPDKPPNVRSTVEKGTAQD